MARNGRRSRFRGATLGVVIRRSIPSVPGSCPNCAQDFSGTRFSDSNDSGTLCPEIWRQRRRPSSFRRPDATSEFRLEPINSLASRQNRHSLPESTAMPIRVAHCVFATRRGRDVRFNCAVDYLSMSDRVFHGLPLLGRTNREITKSWPSAEILMSRSDEPWSACGNHCRASAPTPLEFAIAKRISRQRIGINGDSRGLTLAAEESASSHRRFARFGPRRPPKETASDDVQRASLACRLGFECGFGCNFKSVNFPVIDLGLLDRDQFGVNEFTHRFDTI